MWWVLKQTKIQPDHPDKMVLLLNRIKMNGFILLQQKINMAERIYFILILFEQYTHVLVINRKLLQVNNHLSGHRKCLRKRVKKCHNQPQDDISQFCFCETSWKLSTVLASVFKRPKQNWSSCRLEGFFMRSWGQHLRKMPLCPLQRGTTQNIVVDCPPKNHKKVPSFQVCR